MQLIKEIRDFALDDVFDCGQCFRWNREEDGSYTGTAFGKTVNIDFIPDHDGADHGRIVIDGSDEDDFRNIWRNYLDLDRDYSVIKKRLSECDSMIGSAIKEGRGIRILRQDAWETLISFIISQNNNIPRIKKCIEGLCRCFGEELPEYRGIRRYAFPGPEKLAALDTEDLCDIKLGYRADYIIKTARKVASDGGESLYGFSELSTEEAFERLTEFHGVGPKVANCILLFGLGKYDSFPIDVWMKRVMSTLYGFDENDVNGMAEFAACRFGEYGGFAQQYLFYYVRKMAEKI